MKKLLAFAASLLVAACITSAPQRPLPRYTYKQYPVQSLNVSSVQIVDAYVAPMQSPNIEHVMPDPLPQALHTWAQNRFKAGGSEGTLTITIKNARVTSEKLATKTGIAGALNEEQGERFAGTIQVEFTVDGMGSNPNGAGSVNVNRSQTITEKASLEDRDIALNGMEELMLTDLDAGTQRMLSERLPFLIQR